MCAKISHIRHSGAEIVGSDVTVDARDVDALGEGIVINREGCYLFHCFSLFHLCYCFVSRFLQKRYFFFLQEIIVGSPGVADTALSRNGFKPYAGVQILSAAQVTVVLVITVEAVYFGFFASITTVSKY